MKLIGLQELKSFLEKTDTEHDSVLLMLIEMVSKRMETFLNRDLTYQTKTEKLYGDGFTMYQVRAFPVDTSQPYSVKRDGYLMKDGSDYFLDPDNGLITFITPVYSRPLGLEISYTGGYREGAEGILMVPDDIRKACLYQTAYEFRRRHELGATSITMPDGSMQIQPVSLLPEVKSILQHHRRQPF